MPTNIEISMFINCKFMYAIRCHTHLKSNFTFYVNFYTKRAVKKSVFRAFIHFRQISTPRTGAVYGVRAIDTALRPPSNTFDKFRHRARGRCMASVQSTPRTGAVRSGRPSVAAAVLREAPPCCLHPTKKPLNCRHPVSAAR